jgi:hypothetical protein
MSLRPNRRVKVRFDMRGVDDDDDDEDEDAEAEKDIDEVLKDVREERGRSGQEREREETEDEEEDMMNDEEFHEVSNMVPSRRSSRRRINLAKKVTLHNDSGEDVVAKNNAYDICKDQVCCVCSTELDYRILESFKNLYEDTTKCGKSLYDVFGAIVKEDVQPSFYGSRVCHKCVGAVNEIEELYQKYRRATESFVDTFVLGQRVLDADVCQQATTCGEESAAVEDKDVTTFVDLSKCTVKIVDVANNASFNALAIGYDFQVPVEKKFRASVVATGDNLPASSEDGAGGEDGGLITLTYDTNTGIIEKAPAITAAELSSGTVDVALPQIFMTSVEFEAIRKSVSKSTVYICREDFSLLGFRLLLGHRIREQVVISGAISEEYERQIPGKDARFTCR